MRVIGPERVRCFFSRAPAPGKGAQIFFSLLCGAVRALKSAQGMSCDTRMFRDLLDRTYLSRLRKSTPAAAQIPSAALPSMAVCDQDILLIEPAEWPVS